MLEEFFDELASDELVVDELAIDELREDDFIEDDIFDELLNTLLKLFCDDELELITTIAEDVELDVLTLTAELETTATVEEMELLLFSEKLLAFCERLLLFCDELLATKAELLETAVEFALETALLLTVGVGDGETLSPLPPPHALSTSEKMAIHGNEKQE